MNNLLDTNSETINTNEMDDIRFLERMRRCVHSMNGVPVSRVSVSATDFERLIALASGEQDFTVYNKGK